MVRQREEGDTKGVIIIPNDEFKEFVEFKRGGVEGKIKGIGGSPRGMYIRSTAYITKLGDISSSRQRKCI